MDVLVSSFPTHVRIPSIAHLLPMCVIFYIRALYLGGEYVVYAYQLLSTLTYTYIFFKNITTDLISYLT